uniref:Metallo-beta-lactamase domain-containing protein n=1 Tax=mine drainage metagenome TaxID=410659 RepID=E6Q5R8_9ZZZZ
MTDAMDYEVEFHPVGDATRAGDAISVRYGQHGLYEVIVIDGGTSDSGKTLVEHIKTYYGSNTVLKHVISTHPDNDHASGLREVLSAFRTENLWLHGIWHHVAEMRHLFADKQLTEQAIADNIREAYPIVEELIALANQRGTLVYEPFAGCTIGPFTVLSPTSHAYTRLVPQFRRTPEADVDALKSEQFWLGDIRQPGLLSRLFEKALTYIDESWNIELLREGAVTAAENETSTVLYGRFGDQSILLTGDAGVNGLTWACERAERNGIDLSALNLVQVPHHGSRSNVTPSVLDRLLGPTRTTDAPARVAVVSVPKDDEKHPRKIVMNAFRRRGAPVYRTQGNHIRHHSGTMPHRPNEVAVVPFDWFDRVEDYD